MNRKNTWVIIFLFFLALFLRKAGFGFSSLLLNASGLFLCIYILSSTTFIINIFKKVLLTIFLVLSIAILQYWISHTITFNILWLIDFPLNIAIPLAWVIFSIFTIKNIRTNKLTATVWLMISFIFSTFLILNPRQFHNFYRANTYEEFIQSKYSEQRGIVADLYIEKYKNTEKEKSERLLNKAITEESLSNYEVALELYNKSIDLNPYNPISIYRRGLLKLTKLDLNSDVAYSAIKDFNRALRLDSTIAVAYFHRGLALGYLKLKGRSYLDMKKVWELDSVLTENEFLNKYGSSKKSFSIPFNP